MGSKHDGVFCEFMSSYSGSACPEWPLSCCSGGVISYSPFNIYKNNNNDKYIYII